MPGHSDTLERTASSFDRLAVAAHEGLSRRALLLRAAALATTSLVLPGSFAKASAALRSPHARSAASGLGSCLPAPEIAQGQCDRSRVTWTPTCENPVANGTVAEYNGCGPIGGVLLKGHNLGNIIPDSPDGVASFTTACNAHDCCYGTCGNDKAACDSAAYEAWVQACFEAWPSSSGAEALLNAESRASCFNWAYIYYLGVSIGGAGAFDSAQEEVCDCCGCATDTDCDPGETCCKGSCTDTDTDSSNCGMCGNECGQDFTCEHGTCEIDCATSQCQCPPDSCCACLCCSDGTRATFSEPCSTSSGGDASYTC